VASRCAQNFERPDDGMDVAWSPLVTGRKYAITGRSKMIQSTLEPSEEFEERQSRSDSPGDSQETAFDDPGGWAHLGNAFLQSARTHGRHPAFITDDKATTYSQLREQALLCAAQLLEFPEWKPGTRVALQMENSVEYIAAFYGILIARGVVVPLPVGQTAAWIEQVLTVTDCQCVITENGLALSAPRQFENRELREGRLSVPSKLAAVFFTSGSSGLPKGVMLSHRNLLANATSIQLSLPLQPNDRTLALLPFCHAYGNSVLQSHMLAGAAIVVAGSTTFPETIADAMRRHSVTSFSGVPHLYTLLLRGSRISSQTVPTLRYATVAGGALRDDLLNEFAERLAPAEFFVMYGQTEATARLSCLPAAEFNARCGSIGRGIPGVLLQVVDEADQPVAVGITGEIRAKGPNVTLGYWQDLEGTAQIIRNGWLYTGDIATVDAEGYIYPQGRKSQLMKISGYRLHPSEIEAVITREIPSVEAVAVAFETSDGLSRVALFVMSLRDDWVPDFATIRSCCARELAHYQRPHYISIIEQPPLTPSLKVDRQRLSEWATDAALDRSQTRRRISSPV